MLMGLHLGVRELCCALGSSWWTALHCDEVEELRQKLKAQTAALAAAQAKLAAQERPENIQNATKTP